MAKRRRPEVEDVDDDLEDDIDAGDDGKTPNDAYTGLVVITFMMLLVAAVFVYLDSSDLAAGNAPAATVSVPQLGKAPPAQP